MKGLIHWLSRRRFPYESLISVEISRKRIIHNLNEFRKLAPKDERGFGTVAPVLKSNAYGHGLIEVATILQDEPVPFFIVDSYFEAVALRAQGIKTPLLIIGYTRPETMAESRLKDIHFSVGSLEVLAAFAGKSAPCPEGGEDDKHGSCRIPATHIVRIHLKVDTGMHRQGILVEEIDKAIEIVKSNPQVVLKGICTHLSDADNKNTSFTESQIASWNKLVKRFRTDFPTLKYTHVSATDGHRFTHDIDANVSRLGIGLYGISENQSLNSRLELEPALQVKTIVTGVKKLNRGETTGYGNTFTADRDLTIATIPVGYYEALDRRLSNRGSVLVGKERSNAPIVGRVSMNITTIDVSAVPKVQTGDEVIVISNEASAPNSIVNIAKTIGTISYEVAVKIGSQLKRKIVD